jgi:hypothetical protein
MRKSGSKPVGGPGGRREGAGRPKGAINKVTREILEAARSSGIMPLDVMLHNMRRLWEAEDWAGAADEAERCAPFLHARLSSIDARLDQRVTHVVADAGERLALEIARLAAADEVEAGAGLPNGRTTH